MRRQIVSTMYNNNSNLPLLCKRSPSCTMTSELPALSGKVCLVTGASRGIGKGIALILAKARATVYITGQFLSTKISFLKGKVWRIFTWILELIMGFSCPSPIIACTQTLCSFFFQKSMSHFHTRARRSLKRKYGVSEQAISNTLSPIKPFHR